jgi:hypothetical protein
MSCALFRSFSTMFWTPTQTSVTWNVGKYRYWYRYLYPEKLFFLCIFWVTSGFNPPAVRLRDFPPPGAAALHFAPLHIPEPRRETVSPLVCRRGILPCRRSNASSSPADTWPPGSNDRNERTNVPISFYKRNQNVLVSFPNLSCWENSFDLVQNLFSLTK